MFLRPPYRSPAAGGGPPARQPWMDDPTSEVPAWAASLGEPFDPHAAPLTVYAAITTWFRSNLRELTVLQIELGQASWPVTTRDGDDILRLMKSVLRAVAPGGAGGATTVRDYWLKLVAIVHPDKWLQQGSRVCYAALACEAMLTRCYKVSRGEEAMTPRPMPSVLITKFTPERARTDPPSRFEFQAAKYAAGRSSEGRFADNWASVAWAEGDAGLTRQERSFWASGGGSVRGPPR